MSRLVGNDKVPPHVTPDLRRLKAIRQGLMLRGGWWWPELDGLSPQVRAEVRAIVRDHFTWEAGAPRFTVDGRRIA